MRVPYKYPYLSIFIIGYYLLEHEGYYYRLKEYFGFFKSDSISYVVQLNQHNFDTMTKAPGRKAIIYIHKDYQEEHITEFQKIARKYKEKLRSSLLFGEVMCDERIEICLNSPIPSLLYLNEGKIIKSFSGSVDKKVIKRLIK